MASLFKIKRSCYWQFWEPRDRVTGKRRRISTGCKDKQAGQAFAKDYLTKLERVRTGDTPLDPYEEHRQRSLEDHLDDWQAALEAKHADGKPLALVTIQQTVQRARLVLLTSLRYRLLADINASQVHTTIASYRTTPPATGNRYRRKKGFSFRTLNFYLASTKQFARWAQRDGRMSGDPLAHLSKWKWKEDVRHKRRALLPDELRRLLATTLTQLAFRELSGEDRHWLYLIASVTGLSAPFHK